MICTGAEAPGRPREPSDDIVGAKLDPERKEKREGASGGECDKTERDAGEERQKGKPCDRRRQGGPSRSPRDPRGGRRGEEEAVGKSTHLGRHPDGENEPSSQGRQPLTAGRER